MGKPGAVCSGRWPQEGRWEAILCNKCCFSKVLGEKSPPSGKRVPYTGP